MNRQFNKRRSCSDEGVGDPSCNPIKQSKSSGKHNSNLRQARMIYPFCMVPQQGYAPQNNFVSPQMFSPSLPQPYVTEDSIVFTLLPYRNDLNYQFSLQIGPGQTVYATSTPQAPIMFPISFALNRVPFINVTLPIELTGAIQNGSNLISFQQINTTQPLFLSICMSQPPNIEDLIDKIINEFPHATSLNSQFSNIGVLPFPTSTDPISGGQINQPCRGVNCTHVQCFDLRSFIEKALNENSWVCPICGSMLPYEKLRYDPTFFEIISQFQQAQQQQQQQTMNNESIPPMNPIGNQNIFRPMNFTPIFGYNTPMSAPAQIPMQFSISSETGSTSTQSDDNSQHSQIQGPVNQPPPQENSIFDDFNISIDPYNEDYGLNFF